MSQAICAMDIKKKVQRGFDTISGNSGFNSGFLWFERAGCDVNIIPHGRSESKKFGSQ